MLNINDINLHQIDLNLLVTFETILQEKSVTQAAETLGLTQSAVSLALSRLRNLFNDPLFVRTPEGMLPTPLAEALKDPVLEALTIIRTAFKQNLEFDPHSSERTFRLIVVDSCASVVLPILVQSFHQNAPNVKVQILTIPEHQIREALVHGQAELAIGYYPNLERGFYRQDLYEEGFMTLVRQGHPKVTEDPSHWELADYLQVGHIQVATGTKGMGIVDRVLKERKLERQVVAYVPNFALVPLMVEASDLIATLPEKIALRAAASTQVRSVPPPIELPTYSVSQYWHERSHQDPANQWLRQLLFEQKEQY